MPIQTKAVFFDAADTLFHVKDGVGAQYGRLARKHGVEIDSELLQKKFNESFKAAPPLAFPGRGNDEIKWLEREWWYHLIASVFSEIDFPAFDLFFSEVYTLFEGTEGWSLFPETTEVLHYLKDAGYSLGIISNFDTRLYSVCDALEITHFFKTITVSSVEGVSKPSPDIFTRSLQRAGLNAWETLFIGDSPYYDIEGARGVGMTPLLVDRFSRYSAENGAIRIPDLRSLFGYL